MPLNPSLQLQLYDANPSMHFPPFWHGLSGRQSSISINTDDHTAFDSVYITKEERLALRNLKSNEDRVVRIQDKGSRFVILDEQEYIEKMGRQLDNTLHYAKLSGDPSEQNLDLVRSWSNKWHSEGQISAEIAD